MKYFCVVLLATVFAVVSVAQTNDAKPSVPLSIDGKANFSIRSANNSNMAPVEVTISKMELTASGTPATNTTPAKFEGTIKGTADLPEELQQRMGLPKRFAFELQIRTESKFLRQKPLLSRAEGTYSILVKEPASPRVYLNLTTTFSSEIGDTPQNTLQYVNELIGRSLKPLLGFEPKISSSQQTQPSLKQGKELKQKYNKPVSENSWCQAFRSA